MSNASEIQVSDCTFIVDALYYRKLTLGSENYRKAHILESIAIFRQFIYIELLECLFISPRAHKNTK